jgi:hypothetical protein
MLKNMGKFSCLVGNLPYGSAVVYGDEEGQTRPGLRIVPIKGITELLESIDA